MFLQQRGAEAEKEKQEKKRRKKTTPLREQFSDWQNNNLKDGISLSLFDEFLAGKSSDDPQLKTQFAIFYFCLHQGWVKLIEFDSAVIDAYQAYVQHLIHNTRYYPQLRQVLQTFDDELSSDFVDDRYSIKLRGEFKSIQYAFGAHKEAQLLAAHLNDKQLESVVYFEVDCRDTQTGISYAGVAVALKYQQIGTSGNTHDFKLALHLANETLNEVFLETANMKVANGKADQFAFLGQPNLSNAKLSLYQASVLPENTCKKGELPYTDILTTPDNMKEDQKFGEVADLLQRALGDAQDNADALIEEESDVRARVHGLVAQAGHILAENRPHKPGYHLSKLDREPQTVDEWYWHSAKIGDAKEVARYLADGADINYIDPHRGSQNTALEVALVSRNYDAAHVILDHGGFDLAARDDGGAIATRHNFPEEFCEYLKSLGLVQLSGFAKLRRFRNNNVWVPKELESLSMDKRSDYEPQGEGFWTPTPSGNNLTKTLRRMLSWISQSS